MPSNMSGLVPTGTPSSTDVFNASERAISFKEQLPDLAQKLRDVLTAKFQQTPLYDQYEKAGQDFMAAPANIRADISTMQRESGVPLSPTQQQSIESSKRAAAFAPLQTSSLMLGQAMGGLEDIVGGGVKAFEAASGAMGERANLMNTMRQQEIERQFKEQGIALDWAKLKASSGKDTQKEIKKMEESASLIATQRQKIREIMSLVESGKAPTGLIPGLMYQIKRRTGGTSAEQARLSHSYSDFNTRLFEIAGKAFTGPEQEVIQGMILQMGNAPDYTKNQLLDIDAKLYNKQMQMASDYLLSE